MASLNLSSLASRLVASSSAGLRTPSPSGPPPGAPSKLQAGAKQVAGAAALLKAKDGLDSQVPRAGASLTKAFFRLTPVGPTLNKPEVISEPPALPQAALARLSVEELARVQKAAAGVDGGAVQQSLRQRVESEGFKSSDSPLQAQVLRTFLVAPASRKSSESLGSLLGSGNFRALSAQEKSQVLDVFRLTDASGRKNLVDLTHRTFSRVC